MKISSYYNCKPDIETTELYNSNALVVPTACEVVQSEIPDYGCFI